MKFYVLEPEGDLFGTKWAYADQVGQVLRSKEGEQCPVCGRFVTPLKWLPPHRVKLSTAKPEKWGDFVWGAGFLLIVSERFKEIYEREGLTGIEAFSPVEIVRIGRRKTGDLPLELPAYYLIEIMWGGADQDDIASKVVWEKAPTCSYCRIDGHLLKSEGIILKENSWTGVDIFIARGVPGTILVTERFKEVVERHNLRNAWFIPAEKYGWYESQPGLWYILE
ncbi:MAG: imm11 family protein [Anaerolineae bacterium]